MKKRKASRLLRRSPRLKKFKMRENTEEILHVDEGKHESPSQIKTSRKRKEHMQDEHPVFYMEEKNEETQQQRSNATNLLPQVDAPAERQKKFNYNLSLWIAESGLPLSTIQCKNFQRVVDYSVTSTGGTFKFNYPALKILAEHISSIAIERRKLLKTINKKQKGPFCFTTDVWTSSDKDSFLSVTIHFADKMFFL